MTRFLDGPAARETLLLWRAPLFLRVVENSRAKDANRWDALDQLADEPKPHERVYAYRRVAVTGWVHIKDTRRSDSGRYPSAEYRLCDPQPDEQGMRLTAAWREWCWEQKRLGRLPQQQGREG